MRTDATVTAADIARIADVGRAAVSNWRKRYEDFPQPVGGTSSSPTFSLHQVENWLRKQGKTFTVSAGDRIWQTIRSSGDDLRLGDMVATIGCLFLFLQRHPQDWQRLTEDADTLRRLPEVLGQAVPDVPGPFSELGDPSLMRSLAAFARDEGPAAAFDFLCDRYIEAHSRRLLVTPEEIANLMASLVEGETILDPACGIGTLLVAVKGCVLYGQEINGTGARLTAVRALLHGRDARIAARDSLRDDAFAGKQVDAVVCNPPFGDRAWGYEELSSDPRWEYGLPPRGEPELAWVQHCLWHLKPGGQAAIMMPSIAAGRRSGRRIRANLLRAGALRAVVSLPHGAAPGSSMAPDLWLLHRPAAGERVPSTVLMVDAAIDLSRVGPLWQAYRKNPEAEISEPDCRTVRTIDLLDDEVDVSPTRHLVIKVSGGDEAFAYARERIRELMPLDLPTLRAAPRLRQFSMTTLGELAKAGVVTLLQAPLKMSVDQGDLPVLTLRDVVLGRGPTGCTADRSGAVICEAGDVVTPVLVNEPVARVIEQTGNALGPQLCLCRPDPERLDPLFLAGFLRVARMSGLARASTVSSRIDLRKAQVPRLPIEEQRRYGLGFQRLMKFESAAREMASLSDAYVRLGFAGLVDGMLDPDE
ncbi:N-6 DNA methylase [Microbispora cellulosiformans]|uniref:N-6 DNA methylase n=1 Tax=Microbispora cellulosiformans TaxID=2614688 RepID=A0A5J5K6M2_9ACTN|nr:N-6 DNA methylase [Microbispora cellulosiformans]KAA9380122.1 N-6 DNA methylase [Microbispora cellulosiformans]